MKLYLFIYLSCCDVSFKIAFELSHEISSSIFNSNIRENFISLKNTNNNLSFEECDWNLYTCTRNKEFASELPIGIY